MSVIFSFLFYSGVTWYWIVFVVLWNGPGGMLKTVIGPSLSLVERHSCGMCNLKHAQYIVNNRNKKTFNYPQYYFVHGILCLLWSFSGHSIEIKIITNNITFKTSINEGPVTPLFI